MGSIIVTDLGIARPPLNRLIAVAVLVMELAIVSLLMLDNKFAIFGFTIAFFLLVAFCLVLFKALRKSDQTSCNCFGTSQRAVSPLDLFRNAVLMGCTILGWSMIVSPLSAQVSLELAVLVLTCLVAAIFVVLLLNLHYLVKLFSRV